MLRDDAVIRLTTRGWEQLTALVETTGPPKEAPLRAAESHCQDVAFHRRSLLTHVAPTDYTDSTDSMNDRKIRSSDSV
jgi:hypothetical protein